MEDLISSISGNMHVSQDQYDLKALQEYLAATISHPNNLSISPANAFRPLPPSRSTSSTRKHIHNLIPDPTQSSPAFPSPAIGNTSSGYWNSSEDISMSIKTPRPNALRRSSSYGFGGVKEAGTSAQMDDSFNDDAFAPLCQSYPYQYQHHNQYSQPLHQTKDRWGYPIENSKPNPWAGFSGSSQAFSSFGSFGRIQQNEVDQTSQKSTEDQDAMDEEWADQSMDVIEDEDSVEDVMGLDGPREEVGQMGYGEWERGRRSA